MIESAATRRQAGFSLVELMIAMVVTLIVSGAIYGLIASGQTAFKRDPEISDRQQNIRVAMDIVQKDIANAGVGMSAFFQAFATPLDGVGLVPGAGGTQTDHLLIYANSGECPDIPSNPGPCAGSPPQPLQLCATDGANVNFAYPAPACYKDNQFMIVVFDNQTASMGFGHKIHDNLQHVNFPPGQAPPTGPGSLPLIDAECELKPPCNGPNFPVSVTNVEPIRYEVANDPADGLPGLWRSTTGGTDATGTYVAAPAAAGNWQLLARGIDDFQVNYRSANGWFDPAPAVVPGDYTTIIQEVRVTLSSRTVSIQATKDAQNVSALRAQLTSVATPRAALNYLAGAPVGPQQWQ